MLFNTPQNISIFRIGIELGVIVNHILIANFDLSRTPLRQWVETDLKIFDENIHSIHCQC